jgi:hypothetical protein
MRFHVERMNGRSSTRGPLMPRADKGLHCGLETLAMIFTAQPGYRVITWYLGEDGTENPPARIWFDEYPILAWRTTKDEGLVPVAENEIGAMSGPDLREDYAVITPDGRVLHIERPCESVEVFKAWIEADFRDGDSIFGDERERRKHVDRVPKFAELQVAQLADALQMIKLWGKDTPAERERMRRLHPISSALAAEITDEALEVIGRKRAIKHGLSDQLAKVEATQREEDVYEMGKEDGRASAELDTMGPERIGRAMLGLGFIDDSGELTPAGRAEGITLTKTPRRRVA